MASIRRMQLGTVVVRVVVGIAEGPWIHVRIPGVLLKFVELVSRIVAHIPRLAGSATSSSVRPRNG